MDNPLPAIISEITSGILSDIRAAIKEIGKSRQQSTDEKRIRAQYQTLKTLHNLKQLKFPKMNPCLSPFKYKLVNSLR